MYIYLEEIEALRMFNFWPHKMIDIEKPSSVSKNHEFIWKVPLHLDKIAHQSYVKNYEVRTDLGDRYFVHIQVNIPFHFRYQPVKANQSFTNVTVPNPQVWFDCEHTPLKD